MINAIFRSTLLISVAARKSAVHGNVLTRSEKKKNEKRENWKFEGGEGGWWGERQLKENGVAATKIEIVRYPFLSRQIVGARACPRQPPNIYFSTCTTRTKEGDGEGGGRKKGSFVKFVPPQSALVRVRQHTRGFCNSNSHDFTIFSITDIRAVTKSTTAATLRSKNDRYHQP